nr:amidohydrolase family protein [Mycobacterium sp.]
MSTIEFDAVITGGRVIDPETGLDAVRSVGIRDGRIAAISDADLSGEEVLDGRGLVVAPGFIDLHSHTQSLPGDRIQGSDGVTTALELESGVLPVGDWYDEQARIGRAINYGTSASWVFARITELSPEMGEPHPNLTYFQAAYRHSEWQYEVASRENIDRILSRLEQGLACLLYTS